MQRINSRLTEAVRASHGRTSLAASADQDKVRHKCFISRDTRDDEAVISFIETFGHVFMASVVGIDVTGDETSEAMDEWIDSDDDGVKRAIRENYMTHTTVTILLVGSCTSTRYFVDWEIASSFRDNQDDDRACVVAIRLPGHSAAPVPQRIIDNSPVAACATQDSCSRPARVYDYPANEDELYQWIDDAFNARDERSPVSPASALMRANGPCSHAI